MTEIEMLAKKSSRKQVPALFKKINWQPETVNLDYGGGAYDDATKWLAKKGVRNLVIDPYNRSAEHNDKIHQLTCSTAIDSITLANVLNVIPERKDRIRLLEKVYMYHYGAGCPVYISCYTPSSNTSASACQTRMKLEEYLPEIKEVFIGCNVTIQNGYIEIS